MKIIKIMVGLFLYLMLSGAEAGIQTYWVLFDTDKAQAEQCSMGQVSGIDYRLALSVDDTALQVEKVLLETCSGSQFLTGETLSSDGWVIGLGNGRDGSTLIEGAIPWKFLGAAKDSGIVLFSEESPGKYSDIIGVDETTGKTLWSLKLPTDQQQVATSIAVPTLTEWGILILSALLVWIAVPYLKKSYFLSISPFLLFCGFALSASVVLAVASITIDGKADDWVANDLLVEDQEDSTLTGQFSDILGVYSHSDNDNLFLRLDIGFFGNKGAVKFLSDKTNYKVAELVTIRTDKITLDKDVYDIAIDGLENIKAAKTGEDTLSFLLPSLDVGQHSLTVKLDNQSEPVTLSFKAEPSQTIHNLDAYVTSQFELKLSELDRAITNMQATPELEDFLAALKENKQELQDQIDMLDKVSTEDKKWLALFINNNQLDSSVVAKSDAGLLQLSSQYVLNHLFKPAMADDAQFQCDKTLKAFSRDMIYIGEKVFLSGALIKAPYFPAKVIGAAAFLLIIVNAVESVDDISFACLENISNQLINEINNEQESISFSNKEARFFNVQSNYGVTAQAKEAIQQLMTVIKDVSVPSVSSVINYLQKKIGNKNLKANLDYLNIANISDSAIISDMKVIGERITVAFKRKDDLSKNASFTFSLYDEKTKVHTLHSATLIFSMPVAKEGYFTGSLNQQLTGQLEAEGADSFRIVDQPIHGTVELLDSVKGTFTYTPKKDYKGSDDFSFIAINSQGDSESVKANVLIYNKLPVAHPSSVSVMTGKKFVGKLDADKAGGFKIKSQTSNGVLDLNSKPGFFSYTSNAGFIGEDGFTFVAINDDGISNIEAVKITVAADVSYCTIDMMYVDVNPELSLSAGNLNNKYYQGLCSFIKNESGDYFINIDNLTKFSGNVLLPIPDFLLNYDKNDSILIRAEYFPFRAYKERSFGDISLNFSVGDDGYVIGEFGFSINQWFEGNITRSGNYIPHPDREELIGYFLSEHGLHHKYNMYVYGEFHLSESAIGEVID